MKKLKLGKHEIKFMVKLQNLSKKKKNEKKKLLLRQQHQKGTTTTSLLTQLQTPSLHDLLQTHTMPKQLIWIVPWLLVIRYEHWQYWLQRTSILMTLVSYACWLTSASFMFTFAFHFLLTAFLLLLFLALSISMYIKCYSHTYVVAFRLLASSILH